MHRPQVGLSALTLLASLLVAVASVSAAQSRPVKDIVLVHGILMDGSVWTVGPKGDILETGVVALLQNAGYTVHAVQLASGTLEDDINQTKRTIANVGKPMVVVGHAYGGMPMSFACTDEPNVTALVYVNAFATDAGESLYGLLSMFPPISKALLPPLLEIDAWGNATLNLVGWVKYTLLSKTMATRLHAVQRAFNEVIFTATSNLRAAWKDLPVYYQISLADELLPLGLARFMSERAESEEILNLANTGHLSHITNADDVAKLIVRAAEANPLVF